MSNKFDAGQWSKLQLTLVEDGLGGINAEAYEEAITEIICGKYDLPDSTPIEIEWRGYGSTNITLCYEVCYEDEQIEDFGIYEVARAVDREREFIGELLERAFDLACERA